MWVERSREQHFRIQDKKKEMMLNTHILLSSTIILFSISFVRACVREYDMWMCGSGRCIVAVIFFIIVVVVFVFSLVRADELCLALLHDKRKYHLSQFYGAYDRTVERSQNQLKQRMNFKSKKERKAKAKKTTPMTTTYW